MTVYTAHFEHKALKINIDVDYDTGLERLRAIANPTGAGITDKQRQAMYLARLYLWGEPVDRPVEHGAWMEYVPAVDLAEATAARRAGAAPEAGRDAGEARTDVPRDSIRMRPFTGAP
jgi:hypothetical protein